MSFYIARQGSPIQLEEYIPAVVGRLINRIVNEPFTKVALYGFGDNMKWLLRILRQAGREPLLCDWRPSFVGYDCGGATVISLDELSNDPNTLVVICLEEITALKESIQYIVDRGFDRLPVLYDRTAPHSPYHQEAPFRDIATRAKARAISMISDEQLFDLIQFIRATKDVPGDVVEYGSLHGGSGSILVEAVRHYTGSTKQVRLFDTFAGIPKSAWGLDHRWNGAFSNNSVSEITAAFKDCKNVTVVQGNICETYDRVPGAISFGYIASDTFETGRILLPFIWERLSPGGIMAVCDYGSYPNCIPLTVCTDTFLEGRTDAIVFHPHRIGIFVMKRQ